VDGVLLSKNYRFGGQKSGIRVSQTETWGGSPVAFKGPTRLGQQRQWSIRELETRQIQTAPVELDDS
jgi:hypothetical protein